MKKHIGYYICQLGVFITLILVISRLGDQKPLQMALVVFMAFFYAGWGILHHIVHHDLKLKIVLEYVTIAMLGVAITLFVLKGIL